MTKLATTTAGKLQMRDGKFCTDCCSARNCPCNHADTWDSLSWTESEETIGGTWTGTVFNHVHDNICGYNPSDPGQPYLWNDSEPGGPWYSELTKCFYAPNRVLLEGSVSGLTEAQNAGYDYGTIIVNNVVVAEISSTGEGLGCSLERFHTATFSVYLPRGCHLVRLYTASNDALYHSTGPMTFELTLTNAVSARVKPRMSTQLRMQASTPVTMSDADRLMLVRRHIDAALSMSALARGGKTGAKRHEIAAAEFAAAGDEARKWPELRLELYRITDYYKANTALPEDMRFNELLDRAWRGI